MPLWPSKKELTAAVAIMATVYFAVSVGLWELGWWLARTIAGN